MQTKNRLQNDYICGDDNLMCERIKVSIRIYIYNNTANCIMYFVCVWG